MRADYRGQIVIGDVSRRDGGPFGRHRSHRTGRDVDIWLPVIGGAYRSDPKCANCGTGWLPARGR
ncbi:MAG: penicillin-insensitive murein endopeptidase [Polyangiaceae bacterium]|nr:penicillin-insensitive murein endopeptidase [Polyangiaceae bacterium]